MDNPSLQCTNCGRWKRLYGIDEHGNGIQRFYGGCPLEEKGGEPHNDLICEDCCKKFHLKEQELIK